LKDIRIYSVHFEDNAHPIRKLFKLLHYWLAPVDGNEIFTKKQMMLLDKILNDLGVQQDYFVLESKLKHFRKEFLVKETAEYELALKWELAVHNLRKQLLKHARKRTEELIGGKK
jgi:hypothetical protein